MPDFEYSNARLRAMKSRLLPRPKLEELAEAGSLPALLTALTDTPYQPSVQAALARAAEAGMDCLRDALRGDVALTLGRARAFFAADTVSGTLAALIFRRYDLDNLKAVLRGLARQVPADDILAACLPVGELGQTELAELARTADVRAAIGLSATWRFPLAEPLLETLGKKREGEWELRDLELALHQWHFHTASAEASRAGGLGTGLLEALKLQADTTNVLTALRLIGSREATHAERHLVGPGTIPPSLLQKAALAASPTEAVEMLSRSKLGPALRAGLAEYERTGRLSAFERALSLEELRHFRQFFVRDPLGIGVLLGYLALKVNEVANLRTVAWGLQLGERPDRIRADLMFVD